MRIDDIWTPEALEIIKDIDANVLITRLNKEYPYDECKKYDLIASCTTGTEHIDSRDIPLISLKGKTEFLQDVWATAEHTWALIMALIRKVPFAHNDVCKCKWDREAWQGSELHGKTLGIVGYGRIGQQVARFAEAFGMNIIYNNGDCVPDNYVMDDFDDMDLNCVLKNSDIVTVHVPLNVITFGMFGAKQFGRMKSTAYFVNTSRADIVNKEALYNALQYNAIAGAAIDVMHGEPNSLDFNLVVQALRNKCIITPHISGNTWESRMKTQIFLANKIKEYLNSEEGV